MTDPQSLIGSADAWIDPYWNAAHLRRTVHWLRVLDPGAPAALVLAALTHDIERHFPAPDAPVFDARRGPADPDYARRHQARSARIVGEWLRGQGAEEALVEEVTSLIAVHEDGGWPAADRLQAADSLSFLEVNVDLFLDRIPARVQGVGPDEARAQFRRMYERIRLPRARELARPLYEAAVARVDELVAAHPELAGGTEGGA